jgi:hypothetical protein
MEQLANKVAADHPGITSGAPATALLTQLQARLQSYESLAQSLVECRTAYSQSNLQGIEEAIEIQLAHCHEIDRMEAGLRSLMEGDLRTSRGTPGLLSDEEARRAHDLLRRTNVLKHAIAALNRVYACIVQKSAHNNAILRNLYANALVYADPRTSGRPGVWEK